MTFCPGESTCLPVLGSGNGSPPDPSTGRQVQIQTGFRKEQLSSRLRSITVDGKQVNMSETLDRRSANEHDRSIRNRRANSPSWPGQLCSTQRPDIREQSYLLPTMKNACKPEESIYALIAASDSYAEALRDHEIKTKLEDMGGKAAEDKAKKPVAAGKMGEVATNWHGERGRYSTPGTLAMASVTDASVEALGEPDRKPMGNAGLS